ncbi:MAG: hypothetical protein R8G66_03300 [Cytophagales bacterium]|nr:hypothetical protein [Cytophagales bacterium]
MKEQDEFYIGWQDEAPKGFQKAALIFFAVVSMSAIAFAGFFSRAEKGFVDSYFDFGNLTEVSGHLVMVPAPALLTEEDGKIKTIPLVGFGKFGAGPVLEPFQSKLSGNISNYKVTIRGTYFEYQDKRWMELTEGENSLIDFEATALRNRKISQNGSVTLSGEIVDPKCFFGVMNPGTKAVHRSCARRCISGGIVPVLAIRENGEFVDYYMLEDTSMEDIYQDILPFVGLPITISGDVTAYDDWKVLSIKNKALSQVQVHTPSTIAMCRE